MATKRITKKPSKSKNTVKTPIAPEPVYFQYTPEEQYAEDCFFAKQPTRYSAWYIVLAAVLGVMAGCLMRTL